MEWLLIVLILIMLPLGLWIMKKIDDFLALPTTFQDGKKQLTSGADILVCGKSNFADSLLKILEENDESYVYFEDENSIDTECSYLCLLAVDSDDYKNLSISVIGKMQFNIDNQVLLCNDRVYEKIFRNSEEPFIYITDEPKQMVLIAKQRIGDRKNDYEMD